MAIQFKRQGGGQTSSASPAAPSSLNYGELAVASNGDLYIGNGSRKAVGVLTTNGNKTISGTMKFSGNTTFTNPVNFRGNNTFTGATTFSNIGVTGNIMFSNISSGQKGLYGDIADSDAWRIQGGASGDDVGYLEIATADGGDEPIYVRQYIWDTNNPDMFDKIHRSLTLLNGNGDTEVPGRILSKVITGNTGSNDQGAMIMHSKQGSNNGMFVGSADTSAQTLGTSIGTNLYIKSWWGLGIVDGCLGNGITVGIDCRNGDINCKGNIRASRVYNAVYNDYAEYFPRGEETEPGDLIALDLSSKEELYIRARKGLPVVGVHSNEYGHIIGGERDSKEDNLSFEEYNLKHFIPVGLCGRCRVKTVGKISKGQKIVLSDIPGVGRAYDELIDSIQDYTDSIGIAVEDQPIDDNEIRMVRVKLK